MQHPLAPSPASVITCQPVPRTCKGPEPSDESSPTPLPPSAGLRKHGFSWSSTRSHGSTLASTTRSTLPESRGAVRCDYPASFHCCPFGGGARAGSGLPGRFGVYEKCVCRDRGCVGSLDELLSPLPMRIPLATVARPAVQLLRIPSSAQRTTDSVCII